MEKKSETKSLGWIFKTLFIMALAGTVLITVAGGMVFWHFSHNLPKIITVEDYRPLTVTRVVGVSEKGESLMGEFFKERRYIIPYDKIPETTTRAFISAEDDKFFEHQGVNFASILRAAIANFKAGHVVQGGSTITQQVAKSLLLTPERSFVRKIKEVILANRIESNLSKEQILYLYLNQIYLGHGAYGVQAAARVYFDKDVSELTLAESAILAGMPQAPGKYSPHLNPKRAKERQLYVLRRMYENKFITQSQMAEAAAQPLHIHHNDELNSKYSGYLVEHVRRYLVEKYGEKATYEDGLTVTLPTSPALALAAKKSVQDGLRDVDKRIGYRGPLKRLKGETEIEEALKEARLTLIERKLGYRLLTPDGRLETLEAMAHAGLKEDRELLDPGEIYQAVVTSVDDKKKYAGVMIGAVRAELPFEKMAWAVSRGERALVPSRVVSRGDLIWVKVEKTSPEQVVVSLDQEPQVQGALFSIETKTGNVLAMQGGFDFRQSEFNRAIQASRQPGSAYKPIIYAAGVEKGYTPASIIVDSPIVYEDDTTGKWKPNNFEEKFYGDTTFRQALIKSRNVPTIKLVQAIQIPFLLGFTQRLGLNGQFNPDLSISLGSGSVSLMDLTRTYALFPRGGRRVSPIFFTSIRDRDGNILEEHAPQPPAVLGQLAPVQVSSNSGENDLASAGEPIGQPSTRPKVVLPAYPLANDGEQVLDPRVAYVMTHLMKEVVTHGTGHRAQGLGRTAAGKTGTTNDYLDAWFMGFTPDVVTGVWVGYDTQKPIGQGETGARASLPIWLSYMQEAVKNYPDTDFTVPPGVVFASIDPGTGKLAAPNSTKAIKEAFIEGTEPLETNSLNGHPVESQSDFFKEDIE